MTRQLCVVLLCLALSGGAAPTTKLTEEQAIEKARDFCEKIGQPVTAEGTATFPTARVNDWRQCWQVKFSEDAEVCVADATGDVSQYRNLGYRRRPDLRKPAGQAISVSDARRSALATMEAAGGSGEFRIGRGQCVQGSVPPTRRDHAWLFSCQRKAGEFTYNSWHGATITLDAEDGTVTGFGKQMPSPPPRSFEVRVAKDDSIASARRVLDGLQVPLGELQAIETLIVQPNKLWRGTDREQAVDLRREGEREPRSRVAWVVRFNDTMRRKHWNEVWIDAADGTLLGGARGGTK